MSAAEIDAYLAGLPEPAQRTLSGLRVDILALVPDAQECISYGMPAFKVEGKVVAGFAAFAKHLSHLPHSGSVLPVLAENLAGYTQTKGSLHFGVDRPLPRDLVRKLIDVRLTELGHAPTVS